MEVLLLFMCRRILHTDKHDLIAKCQQVKIEQKGGQVVVRVNERSPYGNGKETVDHSSVAQINASACGRTMRGSGAGRGRERSFPEIGAIFFAKIRHVYKTLN